MPSLILKKVCIKYFIVENSQIQITRQKNNKLYLGKFSLDSLIQILEKFGINVNKSKIQNTKIIFNDKTTEKSFVTQISKANLNYKKKKSINLQLQAITENNTKLPTEISIDFASKLPIEKANIKSVGASGI